MHHAFLRIILIFSFALLLSCKPETTGDASLPPPVNELTWSERGDMVTLTSVNTDFNVGHESANEFAKEIGNRLKKNYDSGTPVRIVSPQVDVGLFMSSEHVYAVQFRWSCRLVKSTLDKADYYFDRRGTLGMGATTDEAKANVQNQLKSSNKVETELIKPFMAKYQRVHQAVDTALSGSIDEQKFVYIEETFVSAGKERKIGQGANANAGNGGNMISNKK